jgi:Nuclease-related domain
MSSASYPRRQLNRRLVRVVEHAVLALTGLLLAVLAVGDGLLMLAALPVLMSLAYAVRSRHWWRLAHRSGVGARSEEQVRARLGGLARDGWRIRHSLRWVGGGDIDHLAIAPGQRGLVFAIETKTRTYSSADLARISSIARWQAQHRLRWRCGGAIPVLCLAGARGVERWEGGVAVVSLDRLLAVMSRLAGTTRKPAFLR